MDEQTIITKEEIDRLTLENVERGIALLNEHLGPEWPNLIDDDTFDLCSPAECVLGQLYHDATPTEAQLEEADRETASMIYENDDGELIGEGYYKGLVILDGDVIKEPGRYGFVIDDSLTSVWYRHHPSWKEEVAAPDWWEDLQGAWNGRIAELRRRLETGTANSNA